MTDIKKRRKLKHNLFCNFMLFLTLVSVIVNFVVIILFQKDSDTLISMTGSLLLCVFTILFIFTAIGNPNTKRGNIIVSSCFLILYSVFQTVVTLGLIPDLKDGYVRDFTNKNLTEVIKWSQKNNVDINQVYEYSDMVDEYSIIGQNKDSSTSLKNLKSLTVVVSEGPNPLKEVVIPNMENWDADRVVKYIKNNHLSNVKISFVSSDKDRDTLIEQSKSGTIKRNEELNLTFSYGEGENLEPIKLKDLVNMSQFDAEFYLKRNGILFDIEKDFSSKYSRDSVMKMNKKVGDLLTPNNEESKILLTISKGQKIKVPDLSKYSVLEITNWVIQNKLKLEFNDKYDDTIKEGKVIDVNYKKGDSIEQKTLISVTISKGKLIMDDFSSLSEFREWADKYSVNYEEKYEFSNEVDEGGIIQFSHKVGDTIKNDDIILVTISQGEKTKVPDLVGQKKSAIIKKLEAAGLKYNFVYNSSQKEKDICIKQSLTAGSEVSKNVTITITLSNGKKPSSSNNTKKESSSSNSQSSNNSTSSNSNSSSTTPECDRSKTIEIDLYTGNNGAQTKTMIQSANPNIKFNFSLVNQCSNGSTASGSVCNANELRTANYCDTYTVIIVN